MCVSVELEGDLFRNTSVCLCGCLSTFTSYKKHRQKVAERKRERAHLHSVHTNSSWAPLVTITDRNNQRCQTEGYSTNTVGFCRLEDDETVIGKEGKKPDFVTVSQQKSPFGTGSADAFKYLTMILLLVYWLQRLWFQLHQHVTEQFTTQQL